MPDTFGNATQGELKVLKNLNLLAQDLLKSIGSRPFDFADFKIKNSKFKAYYDQNPCDFTHKKDCPYWGLASLLEQQVNSQTNGSYLDAYQRIIYSDTVRGVIQYELLTRPADQRDWLLDLLRKFLSGSAITTV